jgi:hypothetical protein
MIIKNNINMNAKGCVYFSKKILVGEGGSMRFVEKRGCNMSGSSGSPFKDNT